MKSFSFTLLIAFASLVAAVVGFQQSWYTIPDRLNPFAPLRIADEPNLLTGFKLRRVGLDAGLCRSVLADSDFQFTPLPDRETGPGCGFENAVTVQRSSVRLSSTAPMSCRSAVSLAMWEKHVVEPAAVRHFRQPLARIDHLGSYACRNIYGATEGRRSRHATADALDVAAFVMADGKRVSVLRDWAGSGKSADFLREVHEGGCRYFDGVLGPAYNAAHRDHFHMDVGGFGACR